MRWRFPSKPKFEASLRGRAALVMNQAARLERLLYGKGAE